MSSDDEQKRHISRVISAIRDDDLDNESPRGGVPGQGEPDYGADEAEDEYYVDEEERRQWDYGASSGDASLGPDDGEEPRRPRKEGGRPAGWGLLLDWRLIAALAILVAGLFMVNFSGDEDLAEPEVAGTPAVAGGDLLAPPVEGESASQGAAVGGDLARLEARIVELEQRLAALSAGGASGVEGAGVALATDGNTVTKDELQVLRDQVNAGLKAQQDATKAAVRDLEQRLTRSIDTKIANAAPAQRPSGGAAQTQPAAPAGAWFVNVATYSQRATADAMVKRLQDDGHSAAIVPATIGGEPSFRVRVTNLSSRDAAQRAARELESQLGVRGLWVGEN